MLIVSQDGERITEKINLHIFHINEDFQIIVNGTIFGVYRTKERAKEVLQEIVEFYETSKRYECSSNNGITLFIKKTFVYEMPKE